jgi:asparagine synthase (glutamine-hydrolysing)
VTARFVVSLDLERGVLHGADSGASAQGCVAVSRGYIANADAIDAEARGRGCAPPRGDDERFALAYRWWGLGLQAKVLGEYAVAVFDQRERRLLVTRDAIGIVPVFVAETRGALVAGSHLADVLRVVGDAPLDEEYVADLFALARPVGARTPYRGIRRLGPGLSLEWYDGRAREHRTWSLADTPRLRLANDAEYEERMRELLADGVRAALRADGPVWCELSGGLDSSTVASVAAAACGRTLPALSVVYERSRSADERRWMRPVLERYGLPWHPVDGDTPPPFTELPPAFAEPNDTMTAWGVHGRCVDLIERNGVAVVLTGHGGDLVFGGDAQNAHHLAEPLARFDLAGLVRGVADWQRRDPLKRSALHYARANVGAPWLRMLRGRTVLDDGTPDYGVARWIDGRYARTMRLARRQQRRYAQRADTPYRQYFVEALAMTGESAGMARDVGDESFAYRSPLLYRPLVEFFFAIPPEQRVQPDRGRVLQRRALAGILPDAVRNRGSKRGGQEAYFEGLRTSTTWLPMLREPSVLAQRGYVDAARWREAVERARFGRATTMHQFITTATLECWFRQRDGATPAPNTTPSKGAWTNERHQPVFQP